MKEIIMSRKEMKQVALFEQLVRQEITQVGAAELLGLTDRQVRNKLRDYKACGPASLAHKNRGRPSTRKWNQEEESKAIELLKGPIWYDFGPTFASEKLGELYSINVSSETLRKRMIVHGLWSVKKVRVEKRKRRERRRMFGSLVQLDGSPHKWLGNDGTQQTLLVFIDDATSKILHLDLVESESLESVMQATRSYIEIHGRPRDFYVDFGSVFKVNVNNQNNEKVTQWERAMKELSIGVSHAHSPQAKGRVERSNRTHQDRLVKELRLRDITAAEKVREFFPEYIARHNKLFAVIPLEETNAHRSLDEYDLESIFCIHESRKIQNDYTVLYKKHILQLTDRRNIQFKPRDEILVKESFNGSLSLTIRGYELEYEEIYERPKQVVKEKVYSNTQHQPGTASKQWNSGVWKKKPYHYQPRIY